MKRRHMIVGTVIGAFGVVLAVSVTAQQSPGRWDTEKYAKLPQPAEEYTPVQVNDKLYLIGGNAAVLTPGARATHPARVMAYDLANNSWTEKKNTPFFSSPTSVTEGTDVAAASDLNVKPFCFADHAAVAPVRANFPPHRPVPNPKDPLLLLSSMVTFSSRLLPLTRGA